MFSVCLSFSRVQVIQDRLDVTHTPPIFDYLFPEAADRQRGTLRRCLYRDIITTSQPIGASLMDHMISWSNVHTPALACILT